MGDRTTVYIEVTASARAAVVEAFGEPDQEDHGRRKSRTVSLVFDDVNDGGFEMLADLARSGLPFLASHDAGCGYHAMSFAACDGVLAAASSPHGELMVGIDPETLEVNTQDVAAVQLWRETRNRVVTLFAAENPPHPLKP